MPDVGNFPVIAPAQKQTFAVDFGNFLPSGIVLTGTPTALISVSYGDDPAPQSRLVSGPTIGTVAIAVGGTGITNAAILFQVYACIAGTSYVVELVCNRTDSDIAEAWGTFSCVPPGGRR